MRTSVNRRGAGVNHQAFADAVRAGNGLQLLAGIEAAVGLRLVEGRHVGVLQRHVVPAYDSAGVEIGKTFGAFDRVAFDAQPELVTTSNAGVLQMLSTNIDPKLIEVLLTPLKAAEVAGETKKGDWVTTTEVFPMIESTGEVSAYGDFNNGGNADVNTQFPQRQSFQYQTFLQLGEREIAWQGLAGIDLASRKNIAAVTVLNKFQNSTYLFGVAGLQNYGMTNDPALWPSIVPSTAWAGATAEQGYQNILDLYTQLVRQAQGWVDRNTSMTLVMSPQRDADLARTNQFGLNVYKLMKENFPGITVKTIPEYSTSTGELMQLMVDEFEGQETMTAAFTEKLRSHAIVQESSSWKQKKSQGTWGTIIFRPVFIAQSLG